MAQAIKKPVLLLVTMIAAGDAIDVFGSPIVIDKVKATKTNVRLYLKDMKNVSGQPAYFDFSPTDKFATWKKS